MYPSWIGYALMARKKDGCLGWIIIACAFIAWLSSGREHRPTVTSTTTIDRTMTVGSSRMPSSAASSPRTQELSAQAVGPSVSREAFVPAASQATEQPAVQNPRHVMSTIANVRLRSSEEADAPAVTTLRKGTAVEVVGSSGARVQVSVPSLNLTGWVHGSYLTDAMQSPSPAPALVATEQEAPKPKAIAPKASPKPSKPPPGTPIRDPVSGSCDCPYDYARNGSLCGGRSAYSRPGGREPICYY